jgi:hypothetical protein
VKRLAALVLVLALAAGVVAAQDFDALPAPVLMLLESARQQWPQLDASSRAALVAAAQQWLRMTPAEQAAMRQRGQAWDRQPAALRAQRRAPFAAWQRLSAADQRRLRTSAEAFARLPVERQQELRAAFRQLPADLQQAWWLGPSLAPDVIAVGGLFAFVPEGERAALLDVVRNLPPSSRMQLAQLTVRMSEAQRVKLRRDLIAATPEQRPEVIEKALAQ